MKSKRKRFKILLKYIKELRKEGNGGFTLLTTGKELIIYPNDIDRKEDKSDTLRIDY
jgi:hypothetical protein